MGLGVDFVFLVVGLAALLAGGEALVRGAVGLARRAGLSAAVIGATVVGFGTSSPELAASVGASLAGSPGIAVGNVVGSNIANVLLIVGLAAVLAPVAAPREVLRRDGAALALVTVVALGLAAWGGVGRLAGAALVLGLAGYVVLALRAPGEVAAEGADEAGRPVLALGLGLGGVLIGAGLLVEGATGIARGLGVSDAVIGLTVVAVGTSLPELATTLVAARRGQGAVALGNVLGSNVFNVLGVLGVAALVAPLQMPPRILGDALVMTAAAALLVGLLARGGIGRAGGAAMLAAYAGYLAWTAVG